MFRRHVIKEGSEDALCGFLQLTVQRDVFNITEHLESFFSFYL